MRMRASGEGPRVSHDETREHKSRFERLKGPDDLLCPASSPTADPGLLFTRKSSSSRT